MHYSKFEEARNDILAMETLDSSEQTLKDVQSKLAELKTL